MAPSTTVRMSCLRMVSSLVEGWLPCFLLEPSLRAAADSWLTAPAGPWLSRRHPGGTMPGAHQLALEERWRFASWARSR